MSVRTEREPFLIDFETEAEAAFLINASTGQILYAKNPDMKLPVASMSKLMTEQLVLKAVHTGQLDWEEQITISERAAAISNTPGFSSVHLRAKEAYSVRDLLEATAIHSGNGAAVALAEAVAGTEENFVREMNEEAANLNLSNSVFYNSTGLTNRDLNQYKLEGKPTDSNMMSARDLAILAAELIASSKEILEVTSTVTDSITHQDGTKYTYANTNQMLASRTNSPFRFPGVDGLKTGYTTDAGYCFAGTLKQNGQRYISVIIGASSIEKRFSETLSMYEEIG